MASVVDLKEVTLGAVEEGKSSISVKSHPLEHLNPWSPSYLGVTWLEKLFSTGKRRALNEADVPELPEEMHSKAAQERFERVFYPEAAKVAARNGGTIPHPARLLFKSIIKAFAWGDGRWRLLSVFILQIFFVGGILTSPLLVYYLMRFFTESQTDTIAGISIGYYYAVALWLCFVAVSFSVTHTYILNTRTGCECRCALQNAIFGKVLRLTSPDLTGGTSVSSVPQLMTVDAERVWLGVNKLHIPISLGSVVIIGCVELLVLMGVSGLAGIGVLVAFIPLQTKIARSIASQRAKMSAKTDKRIAIQTEVLAGMRAVKAYGWKEAMSGKIAAVRSKERHHLRNILFLRAINSILGFLSPTAAATVIFIVHSLLGNSITAEVVFPTFAVLSAIRPPLFVLPKMVDIFCECAVSLRRISCFLTIKETKKKAHTQGEVPNAPRVTINDASFAWKQSEEPTLKHISLKIPEGSLKIIIGQVGSGKSSLLRAILGEMVTLNGNVHVNGKSVSYCGQNPWIQNNSVREGITFYEALDRDLYVRSVQASQLIPDLCAFPHGDATDIGERGVNLSGGQKQRIALARSIYKTSADLFMMDDLLSAVDPDVADGIFSECIEESSSALLV